ncbi:unnamed protein product [Tilletia laevis]|uniref:DUF952 domain-containing protein n=1 Tax=Tilletia laevis TaxID=157183 RepID=A0A9N8LRZ4_9BASI|nr:unnamed protein product [Tilletia caries]CAD6916363.1 unnamed protein product [Tilletia controversa]CAD6920815.1 unnamed protein product [Tilletia laevis]CAD6946249.1 unnamed protein product [Tilletia laevis]CAD6960163.1 unnamed protein product [Tilletia caries]
MACSYPDPRGATVLYKILTSAEAEALPTSPSTVWHGSSLDIKDGFLHASTVHQLPITLQRFFTPENPEVGDTVHIYAMQIDQIPEGKLRWDEIKSGEVFGHVYGVSIGINPATDFSFHRTYHRNSQGLFELDADLPF